MFEPMFNFLLVLLVFLAVVIVELKDLLYAVIVAAIYSIIIALLFYMLQAPDIAITQVVVGAGIQTALFIAAIAKSLRMEE